MADIHIRKEGRAGRITLTRPKALNALSYEMCLAIDAALKAWAEDDTLALILIDAEGEKAFCAGGDIAQMYATGVTGDYSYGRRFWLDEYRMNARLAEYRKPVVSFLQGFVMGGGVGVGCHASHRIVGETSQIAMPECGIGLVPDVGGSWILARAPGALGAYLGLTGARMGPGDAIRAGFADLFVAQDQWEGVKAQLVATGDVAALKGAPAPHATLAAHQDVIDAAFGQDNLAAIAQAIGQIDSAFAAKTLHALQRNSPLAMACTRAMLRNLGAGGRIRDALAQEYRFTWRAMEHADFLEGIRAAIIDKDRSPRWRHATLADVTEAEVAAMLATLGPDELTFDIVEEGQR
ncbi:enoyl-CoA hydratase/carnithine racemase [Roseinatronobacter thiooxidans]|uniref:3-hydroxyisobutyryl-CoA hydrolase n=1 Tax=Roseinatronobacter thiooxidans TaxID=121821 RepID=A0A2W7PRQ5_9RHOB|nr:enoyl-CoA hydratase/isomerase family protein [Roseinatronobacter thiooxidans]PZX36320.1 enoyl-CoA hydratase/carnithine racemase [Roseinatronobacter thiooxidans]